MKKFLLSALAVLAMGLSVNAQTVISNDYGSSTSEGVGIASKTSSEEDDEMIAGMALKYYSFDGGWNLGYGGEFLNPNGLGGEFTIRADVEHFAEHGNYNIELGLNYSFKLFSENNTKLLLVLAVGPSVRMQDAYNFKKDKWDSKVFFDCYMNPRIVFNYKRLLLSGGYYLWAPEFEFGSDYRGDGLYLSLGYTF